MKLYCTPVFMQHVLLRSNWPQPAVSVLHCFLFGCWNFVWKSWSMALFGSTVYEKCMIITETPHLTAATMVLSPTAVIRKLQIFHFFSHQKAKNMWQPAVLDSVVTTYFLFWLWNIKVKRCSNSCCCKINARWMHVGRCLWEPALYYAAC